MPYQNHTRTGSDALIPGLTGWAEGLAELAGGGLPHLLLDVKVMLGHFDVGVAHHALNGLHVHAQGLELGDIGVAAAVGCERTDAHSGHGSLKIAAEMGGVKGLAGHAAVPEKLPRLFPQKQDAGADALRDGDVPEAVGGFRRADAGLAFDQIDGLANVDA